MPRKYVSMRFISLPGLEQTHIQVTLMSCNSVFSPAPITVLIMQGGQLSSYGSWVLKNRFKDHETALLANCHHGDDYAALGSTIIKVYLERWNKSFSTLPLPGPDIHDFPL